MLDLTMVHFLPATDGFVVDFRIKEIIIAFKNIC